MAEEQASPETVRYMRRALRLAAKAAGRTSPNPLVGAVVVQGSEIVGEGFHKAAGEPHAEVVALRAAGSRARGATLYSTLEPCAHTGRTPPCVDAIREAGITRVIAAMRDPDPRTDGKGFRLLRAANIPVTQGMLEEEARRLNEGFLSRVTRGRPFVLVKLATTLDGHVAVKGRRYLTGKRAQKEVHRLRDRYDAVMVGIGTVLADDPALTVREVKGRDPLRVIVDTDAKTPPTSKVVRAKDPQRTIIFVARDADARRTKRLRDAGVLVTTLPRSERGLDLGAVLKWLADQGVNSVSHLADRLMIITAPIAGGEGPMALDGLSPAIDLRALKVQRFGDDVALTAEL
ncbi:MAG: riboflavin biosynthesis protein RibD [Chloroflexi bacterium 13_1_40CM_4_68_4]|nr:MAG: riboflavin biosynthesis protein RibD [Chloroflexi bacterium 13_1_40CM_4_68_4]